jgi:integrase
MAWIEKQKRGGWLVRWREEGKTVSKYFSDQHEARNFASSQTREAVYEKAGWTVVKYPLGKVAMSAFGDAGLGKPVVMERDTLAGHLRRIVDGDKELRETTREQYGITLRTHIEGTALGQADIRAITPQMAREYWEGLDAGVGARRNIYLLLSKAFTRAVKDGVLQVSPLVRADIKRPPKGRRTEVIPLTVPEVEALAAAAADRNPRDRLAVLLMAYAGLRAGEIGGLRVHDVDFVKSKLSVRQQVVRTHARRYLSPLKSKAARRTIEVASSVIDELREFVDTNPPADDGRIFHGPDGSMWAHDKVNLAVRVASKRAGTPATHAHALRHTAVSLLIDDGVNPKAIQAFVGHATITETLQTYGHLFDFGGRALAASMEQRREVYRNGANAE